VSKFIYNLLSESGRVSSTRFMSIIVCITACFIAIWCTVNNITDLTDISLITVLLSTSFTLKIKQKNVEKKMNKTI
jgi:uncharacterized membrane protein AbrB (regulator of aidB expression)